MITRGEKYAAGTGAAIALASLAVLGMANHRMPWQHDSALKTNVSLDTFLKDGVPQQPVEHPSNEFLTQAMEITLALGVLTVCVAIVPAKDRVAKPELIATPVDIPMQLTSDSTETVHSA